MSDVKIPEDILESAERALNAAQEEHDALFNPLSNSISQGLWKRFVEHSACAILAERERCAGIAETHPKHRFGGWSGNPTCHAIAKAIRDGSVGSSLSQPNDEGEGK